MGIFQPYLMACQLPKSHWNQVPLSVSIVENICDKATNNLRVIYNKLPEDETDKKEFAVCVKGLDFPNDDLSVRLIEWIELLHILGVDKIFFYNLEVHPNVTKVLNYYEDKSYIDLTPISLPGRRFVTLTQYGLELALSVLIKSQTLIESKVMIILADVKYLTQQRSQSQMKFQDTCMQCNTFPIYISGYQPNIHGLQHLYLKKKRNNKRQNELIPYNDCLYRNMYRYKYIALLDIDEVILPIEEHNWSDLMKNVQLLAENIANQVKFENKSKKILASYNFRNVYFMDEMLEMREKVGFQKLNNKNVLI